MRALIQRVREASVTVDGRIVGAIGPGLVVLAAMAADDTDADRDWIARKIVALRIFDDDAGVMNRSVVEAGGAILAVSQFTLYASTKKGNRPSWSGAAPPEIAQPKFDALVAALARESGTLGRHRHVRRADAGRARQRRAGDDLARLAAARVGSAARLAPHRVPDSAAGGRRMTIVPDQGASARQTR